MIGRRRVDIELQGPILSRSTSMGGFGVDAAVARLPDGRPYIPGTLLLGRVRDAFARLGRVDPAYEAVLETWFGGKDDQDTGLPRRRRLFASDLTFSDRGDDGTRTRVAIDPLTGSVLEGALQVLEAPFATGACVRCRGELRALGHADEIEALWPRLNKALDWITQLGGMRTVGYGIVRKVALSPSLTAPPTRESCPTERLRITIDVHDPLCAGERRNTPNLYGSSNVIPGGAIKGTMAQMLLADDPNLPHTLEADGDCPLRREFSRLRITHAFPVERPGPEGAVPPRPSRVPFSWVTGPALDGQGNKTRDVAIYDAALADDPAAAHTIGDECPRFAPDWKASIHRRASAMVGWVTPATDLRVHTAIDETRRAASTSQLFALEHVTTTDHLWAGEIDLSGVDDWARVADRLQDHVADGLVGLGRSGSSATVRIERTEQAAPCVWAEPGRIVLVLQTAAVLREPAVSGNTTPAYARAFAGLAPASGLRLRAVFVRERLAGGEFVAARHRRGMRYMPYLLTEPGSTFVFGVESGREHKAEDTVRGWVRRGIEMPPATMAAYGLDRTGSPLWQTCPFIRENGFGEVATTTRLVAGTVLPLHGPGIVALPPQPGALAE